MKLVCKGIRRVPAARVKKEHRPYSSGVLGTPEAMRPREPWWWQPVTFATSPPSPGGTITVEVAGRSYSLDYESGTPSKVIVNRLRELMALGVGAAR